MNYYTGEIIAFAGAYVPENFMLCDGSMLNISDQQILYSIIGTTFGGNATQFALPNLQSLVVVGAGQRPGGDNYVLGAIGGVSAVTLTADNMYPHTHTLAANSMTATTGNPSNAYIATSAPAAGSTYKDARLYAPNTTTGVTYNSTLNTNSVSNSPGGQPHNNIQPYLTISYIICVNGIYPDPA